MTYQPETLPMEQALFWVELVIWVISIYGMIYAARRITINKIGRMAFIPILVWAVVLFIFYTLILYCRSVNISIDDLFGIKDAQTILSAIQRLHGVSTMIYVAYILDCSVRRHAYLDIERLKSTRDPKTMADNALHNHPGSAGTNTGDSIRPKRKGSSKESRGREAGDHAPAGGGCSDKEEGS